MDTLLDNSSSYLTPEVLLSMFERTPLGKAIIGLDFRFLEVNPSLCRMLGYTADELKAMTFVDVTFPEDVDADVRLATQLLKGEITHFQMEKRYIHKDGTVFWIHLTAYMLRDDQGLPTRALSVIENIDVRKRQDEELRASRELLRTMGEIAHVGGWEVEFPSLHLRWTEEVFHIHGLPVGEIPPHG